MSKKGGTLYCIGDWMWDIELDSRFLTGLDSLMSEMRLFYLKENWNLCICLRYYQRLGESESTDYVKIPIAGEE